MRSFNICRSLLNEFHIDFLLGGQEPNIHLDSPFFRKIALPPIFRADPEAQIEAEKPLEETFALRKQALQNSLDGPYDFFITEFFPFNKWMFKDEVESIILQLKVQNPKCLIISSLRDTFSCSPVQREEEILETLTRYQKFITGKGSYKRDPIPEEIEILSFLKKYYNYVFMHSDPSFFLMEESFAFTHEISEKVIYTGFITNPEDTNSGQAEHQKRIVVSVGAGSFGSELLIAAAKVAHNFPDYEWIFFLGPKSPPSLQGELEKAAGGHPIQILPFSDQFGDFLKTASLAINLGGYTIIDAVKYQVPALVYPRRFFDQYVRGAKFAALGAVTLINDADLNENRLTTLIRDKLDKSYTPLALQIQGAQNTTKELKFLLEP